MTYSTQLIIDADMTEHGWEIVLRFTAEDAVAIWSDVSDNDLAGLVGEAAAEALITDREENR